MRLKVESERGSFDRTKVSIDGVDIKYCTGITVDFKPDSLPEATITLIPNAIEVESDVDAFVQIGKKRYRVVGQ